MSVYQPYCFMRFTYCHRFNFNLHLRPKTKNMKQSSRDSCKRILHSRIAKLQAEGIHRILRDKWFVLVLAPIVDKLLIEFLPLLNFHHESQRKFIRCAYFRTSTSMYRIRWKALDRALITALLINNISYWSNIILILIK